MSNEVNIPENQVTELKEGEDIQPQGEASTSDAGDAPESTLSEVSTPSEGEPVSGATEAESAPETSEDTTSQPVADPVTEPDAGEASEEIVPN